MNKFVYKSISVSTFPGSTIPRPVPGTVLRPTHRRYCAASSAVCHLSHTRAHHGGVPSAHHGVRARRPTIPTRDPSTWTWRWRRPARTPGTPSRRTGTPGAACGRSCNAKMTGFPIFFGISGRNSKYSNISLACRGRRRA